MRTVTKWGDRNDCCGLWSWGDKQLVDAETHEARKAAHDAFDPLWQSGRISRSEAYRELRRALQISEKSCHMARMKKELALQVPSAVERIKARLNA
ncbi:zinc-finger-containing protein [Aquamicrobium soli]|uniref:Zinc-finger-containing protein n=1 Tax=Aquamicrobium soli TaxID=1811518 RepID=A0ABV7KAL0_9HYPH